MRAKKKTTLKSFLLLAGITIGEKIVAFVFEAIIAAFVGTNYITDGYFTSSELFSIIESAFLSAIIVVALNRYAVHVNQEGEEKGFEVLSALQSFYMPMMVVLTVILFCAAWPLARLVAPGYDEQGLNVVVRCIRVKSVIPSIVCITCIRLAVLRQKKEFGITGLKSLFISVVGIISVLIFGRGDLKNADFLSIAYVVSAVVYCLLVSIRAGKYGRVRFHKPTITPELKDSLKMLMPLMISYGVGRLALMVDKVIASTLAEGSVSALTYSHSLYKVVAAVFVTNLSTIILTDFNNLCSMNEIDKVAETMRRTVSTMTLVLLPVTIVSVFNSNEIVKIVYERGKFTPETTLIVGGVLLFYAINFVPVMIQGIYNQALYAFGDTSKPMISAIVSVVVNLGTSVPLAMVIGLPGVAIGTCVSTIASITMSRIFLKKHVPSYRGCYKVSFVIKTAVSTLVCVGSVFLISILIHNALWSFVVSAVVAFAVFFAMELILREEIAIGYFETLLKKIRGIGKKKTKTTV